MQQIADVADEIQPGKNWQRHPPVKIRTPQRVSLDTLDTSHPQVADAIQAARDWQARQRDGYLDASLILSGPYGTGKTHIARAILWSITDGPDGHPGAAVPAGRFFLANDLILAMATVQDKFLGIVSPPHPAVIVGTAPIVVIDDVGGEQDIPFIGASEIKQSGERHARYFRFVDYCYTNMTALIVTTNLSLKDGNRSQFANHIGGRAYDRLSEMAPAGFMVGLDGVPSWRMKKSGR
jgi:DNA replication protein DnaC